MALRQPSPRSTAHQPLPSVVEALDVEPTPVHRAPAGTDEVRLVARTVRLGPPRRGVEPGRQRPVPRPGPLERLLGGGRSRGGPLGLVWPVEKYLPHTERRSRVLED